MDLRFITVRDVSNKVFSSLVSRRSDVLNMFFISNKKGYSDDCAERMGWAALSGVREV